MLLLQLLTTGGTIDKTYGSGTGVRDLHIGPSVAPKILRGQRLHFGRTPMQLVVTELVRKDSLDLTNDDRAIIALACTQTSAEHILITHGTDTMHETAKRIYDEFSNRPLKTVVITGALLPACVTGSDASFNLGLAACACMTMTPGIYIAMNGVHHWMACRKNKRTGTFEPF